MECQKRHSRVARFPVLAPADGLTWSELDALLRDVRYRVHRLANLAVSEAYLGFYLWRTGQAEQVRRMTIGQLSRQLREMLSAEGMNEASLNRISKVGATPSTIHDALDRYRVRAITSPRQWGRVIRGKTSLPVFRNDMAVPVRCDLPWHRRLETDKRGGVLLELMICVKPYPRIVLHKTRPSGNHGILVERLLANPAQELHGYRQRYYEIRFDASSGRWWVHLNYDFPAEAIRPDPGDRVVGVDLGVSCPAYVALNEGEARLGRSHFTAAGERIRALQRQHRSRRRRIQQSGANDRAEGSARCGHGRKRRLAPLDKLRDRLDRAYRTLNHQISAAIVRFARDHGARIIQMEDLSGLRRQLAGTYLGAQWRYRQLTQFLAYKAEQAGIEVRSINPCYTSRRCSGCGFIFEGFDRSFRRPATRGQVTRFVCPQCGFEADPDFNAARNIAQPDIEKRIRSQCRVQGLPYGESRRRAVDGSGMHPVLVADRYMRTGRGCPAQPEG